MRSKRPRAPLVLGAVLGLALIASLAAIRRRPEGPDGGPESGPGAAPEGAGGLPAGAGAGDDVGGRDRRGAAAGHDGRREMPTLLDPALVPGKPGVGVPPEVEAGWAAASDVDPERRDRNRSPDRFEPRPVIRPQVAEREVGQPPSPQGAGIRAREVWTGEEPTYEDGSDPVAIREGMRAALDAELSGLRTCFPGGAVPPLLVTVERIDDGLTVSGYVARIDPAGGGGLPEAVDACLAQGLAELVLAAPPGARQAQIAVGPR